MAYTKDYTIDAGPAGDTVKDVITVKIDGNIDAIFADLNTHEALTTGAHGVGSGTIVGTALTQTLTNKTLSGGTLTGSITADGLTLVGFTATLSGQTITNPTITGTVTWTTPQLTNPTITGATLTGTVTASGVTWVGLDINSMTNGTINGATLSGTITGTNATLTNATLSGTITATGVTWVDTPAATNLTDGTITNCTLTGTITGTGATLTNATFTGTITSSGATLLSPTITGATLANPTISLASSTNGDMWYQASGTVARLAKGTANAAMFMNAGGTAPEWAAGNKVIKFTRAHDATGGDVAYTGVGFKPSSLAIIGTFGGQPMSCSGFATGTDEYCIYQLSGTYTVADGVFTYLYTSGPAGQSSIVKSMDADGFTLTWTRNGSPGSGTETFYCLCIR
jgi:uncharacterized protein YjbI with pentapeptide repeats